MIPNDWAGDERRAIPIHILNHIDERLDAHATRITDTFKSHEVEEMERYKEILELIERNNEENRRRHAELCRSVDQFSEKSERIYDAMCAAFVKDPKGDPDFHGHAKAHESWIEERMEQKEFHAYIKKVVSAAVATALTMWLGLLVWQGVLAGPK